ncbi:ABC transporter ATP-binding protein [Paraburkholderia sp. J12]|uniref:ABC transporter ATP-binding protein n=1 Tax=Paraburkholderia sp. J12 TaxID=2805432 RepID=UPI002ABDDC1A|nr:ABC transporter ATP-binding protein [Paraburkholderia sp. J12]
MIDIQNVVKKYPLRHGREHREVLSNVNFRIMRGEKWGILGRNGAGKSTLVRLISGAERPSSGRVSRDMSVSWPLAFGDAFQSSLTGRDNLKLICRAYNVDFTKAISFVEDFAELGPYIREPIKNYSSGMSARLAFAISMVVEFDCYLIDEVVAVGDYRFVEKCENELFARRKDRAMIMVSHNAEFIKKHCEKVAVLDRGKLTLFDDVDEGNAYYLSL